jgi:hypothetical protein
VTDRSRFFLIAAGSSVVMLLVVLTVLIRSGSFPRAPESEFVPARLPHFESVKAWLNRGSFAPESLAGHPAVVVLWSDTNPSALDVLPLVQSWWQAYSRYGVRVLGVHSPEFAFAADPAVPNRVVQRLGLGFPIALDPNYEIRNRFGDAMPWPGLAVADTAGRIVLQVPVSGASQADRALRKLLRRLHPDAGFPDEAEVMDKPAVPTATRIVSLGAGRVRSGPLAGVRPGTALTFTTQFRFQEEGAPFVPYPVGRWIPGAEGLVAVQGGAPNFIAIRHGGERVRAVIGPPPSGPARVWILENETWLGAETLGEDVSLDPQGASFALISEPRIYEIAAPGKSRVLRFSPENPGVTFYAFLFESRREGGVAGAKKAGP